VVAPVADKVQVTPEGRRNVMVRTLAVLMGLAMQPSDPLVLEGATVIDVAGGSAIEDAVVVVIDDRITAVGPRAGAALPEGATRVDARGKFLIPGLADMHVHVWDPSIFPLFLASGVTLIRDCGGMENVILGLKSRVAKGELLGPRIFCVGPIFDGKPPIWWFSVTPETPEAAVKEVDRLQAAGVDMIKVYSLLRPEIHRAVCQRAREVGLKVTGHVPVTMNAREAVENGQSAIEHCDRLAATARGDAPKDPADRAQLFRGPREAPDPEAAGALVRFLVEKGTVNVPTLAVLHHASIADTPEGRTTPYERYLPLMVLHFWRTSPIVTNPNAALGFKAEFRNALDFVKRLRKAGGILLAGTDTPNPYVVPGFSLHEELELLVQAGLTPVDAIGAATLVPARFLGIEKDWGSIAAGKIADLVLLERDPRADVAAVRSVAGVCLRGRWLSREELDERLAQIARPLPEPEPAAEEEKH
jgi:imidazolonepropionase-like amidohydrolase